MYADLRERSAKGSFLSGWTVKFLFDLKVTYLEKKLNAFIDSIKELMELGEVTPSLEWQGRLRKELQVWLNAARKELWDWVVVPALKDLEVYRQRETLIVESIEDIERQAHRRFELLFFDGAARVKMGKKPHVTIGEMTVHGIANFGEIMGNIEQSINLVKDSGNEKIAKILEELIQVILNDKNLVGQNRQEAIESIQTITEQASIPNEKRKLGIIKATLLYIPGLLSASADVLNYFQVNLKDIKSFFGI